MSFKSFSLFLVITFTLALASSGFCQSPTRNSEQSVFIAGEVISPGEYLYQDGMSVRQALAIAQGTTPNSKPKSGLIFRVTGKKGLREEIQIDIDSIAKGKIDDVKLMPGDILIVPARIIKERLRWKSEISR